MSKRAPELEELVRRSRRGDRQAFGALVDRYRGVTFGLAYRMLGDYDLASDVTQEIFIRAWRGLPRFAGAARFSTWLHTIAVNCCCAAARRQSALDRRMRPLEDPGGESAPGGSASRASDLLDWDLRLALRDALERLPEAQRVVVALYYYGGYTLKEIGEALDVPLATVYSRLRAALSRLGRGLEGWELR